MLAIGLDQVLQGLNQTPWLGCFLFAITVTDCHAKNLIKFLEVLRKYCNSKCADIGDCAEVYTNVRVETEEFVGVYSWFGIIYQR